MIDRDRSNRISISLNITIDVINPIPLGCPDIVSLKKNPSQSIINDSSN